MSVPDPANLKPHDLARAEIDAWRGRCLNIFSRGERAVTDSLIGAHARSPDVRIEPLAGQRLNTLEKLTGSLCSTDAQKSALQKAIRAWRQHDEKRPYFSHGVVTELLDRQSRWHAQFDYLVVQKGVCEPRRMIWSQAETATFEETLHEAYTALARELGQLRKRLAA